MKEKVVVFLMGVIFMIIAIVPAVKAYVEEIAEGEDEDDDW